MLGVISESTWLGRIMLVYLLGTSKGFDSQVSRPSGAGGAATNWAWITDCSKEHTDYLLTKEDEEEDEVEQRLDALERAQEKFHQDLEEKIRVIPDMVV
ncbi:UNVERIFIED_CONTAM: hypothetical protein K2H54_037728 [Gekko kuhli]